MMGMKKPAMGMKKAKTAKKSDKAGRALMKKTMDAEGRAMPFKKGGMAKKKSSC